MIWVVKAKALPQYRLWLQFSDGKEGEIDLKEFIFADTRAVTAKLRDANAFAAIRVDLDTVVWDSGFDLAPEFLYERLLARVA